ncbi:DNA polymerase III subunit epsilon [Buchnera aphidicola (Cinara kochiana kochiana)]|uniref:DNA polymerase III subunit epsilon n=1 Tax=Buchnera aphidicola (Cinara kochiana kochiana) TaxID=2518976 RepID=A0A451D5H8_9GAMM|nr:DNA polymerase III subunit epsilon [Buchnera aphidicola]VFP81078.1 DNA polymerase III subunit epsilon [Buchnera aphidicola (Cinara kochiana kochiana)]
MNILKKSRKVVLDIETTGMNKSGCLYLNHKIIEIGILEIIDRKYTGKYLHYYLNPDRDIEKEAYKIHGISRNQLIKKPRFKEVYLNILNFIKKSKIVVHNSIFDISFLDYEFSQLNCGIKKIREFSTVIDTLVIARQLFPGKKNNLDALCRRYNIINTRKTVHGALIDAKILMKLYLYMTSKQITISFTEKKKSRITPPVMNIHADNRVLKILFASKSENKKHEKYMKIILKNYI